MELFKFAADSPDWYSVKGSYCSSSGGDSSSNALAGSYASSSFSNFLSGGTKTFFSSGVTRGKMFHVLVIQVTTSLSISFVYLLEQIIH